MIFIKEETYRRFNLIRTAAILLAAAGLAMAFFSGCSPAGKAEETQGTSVIASSAEDKDNYEKADYTLSQVEGNVSNFSLLTSEVTEENTWLLFTDNNETGAFTYYIYNVNEDKYETVADMGFNYYTDGFYDINGRRQRLYTLRNDCTRYILH